MTPSIGRIVHYVNYRLEHQPAIVVWVHSNGFVNLQVFTDSLNTGDSENVKWVTSVAKDDKGTMPNTWHWPVRDDE